MVIDEATATKLHHEWEAAFDKWWTDRFGPESNPSWVKERALYGFMAGMNYITTSSVKWSYTMSDAPKHRVLLLTCADTMGRPWERMGIINTDGSWKYTDGLTKDSNDAYVPYAWRERAPAPLPPGVE